jgi:hypothetical protein
MLLGESRNVVAEEFGGAAIAGDENNRAALFGGMVFKIKNRIITCPEKIVFLCHNLSSCIIF